MKGLFASGSVSEDPASLESFGMILFEVNLDLNPTDKEQQFRIATSQTKKASLPWGEATEGEAKEVMTAKDESL